MMSYETLGMSRLAQADLKKLNNPNKPIELKIMKQRFYPCDTNMARWGNELVIAIKKSSFFHWAVAEET